MASVPKIVGTHTVRSKCPLTTIFYFQNLLDEHAQGFFGNFVNKVLYISEYIYDNVEHEHIWAFLSVVGTIVFILVVGYFMANLVRIEEENLKKNGSISSKPNSKFPFG